MTCEVKCVKLLFKLYSTIPMYRGEVENVIAFFNE